MYVSSEKNEKWKKWPIVDVRRSKSSEDNVSLEYLGVGCPTTYSCHDDPIQLNPKFGLGPICSD